jgi:hypothetical protein
LRLRVAWIVCLVRLGITNALHVLSVSTLSQTCSDNTTLTSTCALSHLSMLNDLTFEMCVPSLRCKAAQRMHKNMPSYSCVSVGLDIRNNSECQETVSRLSAGRRTLQLAHPTVLSA